VAEFYNDLMTGWLTDLFSFFDFPALWRSTLSARVPESQKLKMFRWQAWYRIPEL